MDVYLCDVYLVIQAAENVANPDQCRLCDLEQAVDKGPKKRKPIPKLAKELLSDSKVQFFLPEKLNQDRLEVLFSKLRQSLGDSDNPTVEEVRHRIIALLVSGRHIMAPQNTNSVVSREEDASFLPKRKNTKNSEQITELGGQYDGSSCNLTFNLNIYMQMCSV